MSQDGLESIDHTVHLTHTWINELDTMLGLNDKHRSYRLLRCVLQALRDWFPVNESADFAAQLPNLLRGVVVVKAREFFAKDIVTIPDDASNPADDKMIAVLEDHRDDPVVEELTGFISALTEDEQIDLVALAWLGRDDATIDDWDELRVQASRAHNKRTASYLLGMPLLPDHLEDALSQFGCSCGEFEMGRL